MSQLSLPRIIGSIVSIIPRYGNMMEHISHTNENLDLEQHQPFSLNLNKNIRFETTK